LNFVSYAQNLEDVMLWRALGHVEHGFYVDIGAQDPVVDSVSRLFFERGWRGVHIEPSAAYATRLRAERPQDEVLQVLVSDTCGVVPFFEIPNTGLSTSVEEIANRHGAAGFAVQATRCPSVTLDDIVGRHADREVHWLKIDVEGAERKVLQSWTLPQPQPWIVLVESTQPMTRTASHDEWESLLLGRGYDFVYFDGLNRFYVSDQHPELKSAFDRPPNVFDGFALSGSASSSFASKLNADIRAVKEDLSSRDEEKSRTAEQLADVSRQLDLNKQVELQVRDDLALATQTAAQAQQELATARDRSERDRATIEAFNRELAGLRAQLTELHSAASDELRRHEDALAKTQEHAHALATTLSETLAQLKAKSEAEARLMEEAAGHALQLTRLERELDHEREQSARYRNASDESAASLRALQQSIGEIGRSHEATVASLEADAARAKGAMAEKTELLGSATAEAATLRQQNQMLSDEVAASRTAVQAVQAALDAANAEIADRRRELASLEWTLGGARAELDTALKELKLAWSLYRSIEGSRSWRLMKPFRVVMQAVRRSGPAAERTWDDVVQGPRRAAKAMLLGALTHLRDNPARKQWVKRVASRSVTLDARLRRFARANPPLSDVAGQWSQPPAVAETAAAPLLETPQPKDEILTPIEAIPAASHTSRLRSASSRWRSGQRLNVQR
jgi:FkbM family methyltransferase